METRAERERWERKAEGGTVDSGGRRTAMVSLSASLLSAAGAVALGCSALPLLGRCGSARGSESAGGPWEGRARTTQWWRGEARIEARQQHSGHSESGKRRRRAARLTSAAAQTKTQETRECGRHEISMIMDYCDELVCVSVFSREILQPFELFSLQA